MMSPLIKIKFSSKGLNKPVLEQSDDGPVEKYRRVLIEKVNVTWNKEGSEQTITLLPPMNKLRKVSPSPTFLQKE